MRSEPFRGVASRQICASTSGFARSVDTTTEMKMSRFVLANDRAWEYLHIGPVAPVQSFCSLAGDAIRHVNRITTGLERSKIEAYTVSGGGEPWR